MIVRNRKFSKTVRTCEKMPGLRCWSMHRFTLLYALPPDVPEVGFTARLFEAGCNDALVGLGRPGFAALEFEREAPDRESAVRSAQQAVTAAWPAATLVEVR